MIKKIGSNKYGVVEYAISSVEDIADLPLGVAIGSTAVLINKDGIRTFALGEGEWVEYIDAERYDKNKLAQDLLFCGFGNDGEKHDDLDDRLIVEFDEINERVNVGNYLEYNGHYVKADYSLEGLQRGVMLEGKTLQNICVDYSNEKNTFTLKDKVTMLGSDINYDSETYRIRTLKFAHNLKPNTTYTIIVNIHSLETLNNGLGNYIVDGDGITHYSVVSLKGSVGVHIKKFTTNNTGAKTMALYIDVKDTSAVFSCPIILEGDYTQTPSEELPFIEGIESVGDKGKNLIDVNAMSDGGLTSATGEFTNDLDKKRTGYIEIIPNKPYITNDVDSIFFYDENKNYIERQLVKGITPINAKYMVCRSFKYSLKPQFNYGEVLMPYDNKYEGYKIRGKSCGKNLFDVNSLIENKKIDENGNVVNGTQTVLTDFIKLKENTMYSYIVQNPSEVPDAYNGTMCSFFDVNKKLIKQQWMVYFKIFNSDNSCYLRIHFDISGGKAQTTLENIKTAILEESPTPTTYEPYQESAYSYILDEPLHSLPNGVCDTIDLETGVLTRRVGKVVVDGTEAWRKDKSGSNESFNDFRLVMSGLINKNKENGLCNNIAYCSLKSSWIGTEEGIMLFTHPSVSELIVSIPVSKANDLEAFKQWLQVNPTTVLYELVEPIIHQLDKNRIYSFKDTTHITSDNLIAPRITTNILTNSNALISHLKGENLALANEVSTLSLRNRETQETNETQDHIIDVSLCAVDELYMMYETTQEVEAMSVDEEGSRMVDMYVAMVQRGLKTISQVPARYREKVREILEQLED